MCLFLVVLIIVLEFQMNIIEIEDKKKYTKSSETNSIEFFISRDSIIFIYFTYILHTAFYILYVYIYK